MRKTGHVAVHASSRTYTAALEQLPNGRARVQVPFDPNEAWGPKREHHVGGSIRGYRIRGSVVLDEAGWSFSLGPAWLRDSCVGAGAHVLVTIFPEGPQRADLAPDVAAALDDNPEAGAFFDSLAQFYRKGYLKWIDATKRRPDVRAQRIADVVGLLSAGIRERPTSR